MSTHTDPYEPRVRARATTAQPEPEPMPDDPSAIEAWADLEGSRLAALPKKKRDVELRRMLAEVEAIQAKSQLPALTPTQDRRLAKQIAGESLAAIAASEKRSKSSVAESLRTPAVRKTLTILGESILMKDGEGKECSLFHEMLTLAVMTAHTATKAVVLANSDGSTYVHDVPDHKLRADVALRLVGLFDKPQAPIAAPAPLDEIIAERVQRSETTERVTARTRRDLRP